MTTVAQFIEWLKTQDQGAFVEVIENNRVVQFNPDKHADYTDLRGSKFVKFSDSFYNKRSLQLGVTD